MERDEYDRFIHSKHPIQYIEQSWFFNTQKIYICYIFLIFLLQILTVICIIRAIQQVNISAVKSKSDKIKLFI